MDDFNIERDWPCTPTVSSYQEYCSHIRCSDRTIFRGVSAIGWGLEPSLGRFLKESNRDALGVEVALLDAFNKRARHALDPLVLAYLKQPDERWHTQIHTGTMFVGRHFGLPTRCLDWSRSADIALFFACNDKKDTDGVVWHVRLDELCEAAKLQWQSRFGKPSDVEADMECDFLARKERKWISHMKYIKTGVSRAKGQKAVVTHTGHICNDHAFELTHLGVKKTGRIAVAAHAKDGLLRELASRGTTSESLGLTGAGKQLEAIVHVICTNVRSKLQLPPRT
ncbi:MAG: FRG domain-containing protein [Phycisphaerales bacterium]|nr:FRG domain-containing protein [Planctomycetota bacterium]